MLADAAMKQAEAAGKQAEAAQKQADAAMVQARNEERSERYRNVTVLSVALRIVGKAGVQNEKFGNDR